MWLRAHLESSHFPRRVLVVEPLRSECSRLCNILTAGEMEVYAAGDLISAVHAVASFQPDLILAQLRLPTHSGLALVRRVKEDEATSLVPVILYGDLTTAEERIRGARSWGDRPDRGTVRDAQNWSLAFAPLKARHIVSILSEQSQRDHLTGLANRSTSRTICSEHGTPIRTAALPFR